MRRPARQPHDLERRVHAAISIGITRAVDFHHPVEGGAPERLAAALDERIGRAHAPQVMHQIERRSVPHHDAIDIGDRQGEAGTLQQRTKLAHIDERRHPRRYAAFDLRFRRCE